MVQNFNRNLKGDFKSVGNAEKRRLYRNFGAGRFYIYLNGEGIGAALVKVAGCPIYAEPLSKEVAGICIFDDGYTDIISNAYCENGVEILPAEWREVTTA